MPAYDAPGDVAKRKPAFRVTPLEGTRPREIIKFVGDEKSKTRLVKEIIQEPAGYMVEFPFKRHGATVDSVRVRDLAELTRLGFHTALPEYGGEVPLVDEATDMVVGSVVNRPNSKLKEK